MSIGQGQAILNDLQQGFLLRFYDHGSGAGREAYVQTGLRQTAKTFAVHAGYGLQAFYRLRKAGKIVLVGADDGHDFYGLAR